MPVKNEPTTAEQASGTPQPPPSTDIDNVLATLKQVFSTFRDQLEQEAPKPFDGAALVAVNTFNDIVAGLQLKSRPRQPTSFGAVPPPSTVIELKWEDDFNFNNLDGYKLLRCKDVNKQDCGEPSDEHAQLKADARSFVDSNLDADTTYRYRLVAFNLRGSTNSAIAPAKTA